MCYVWHTARTDEKKHTKCVSILAMNDTHISVEFTHEFLMFKAHVKETDQGYNTTVQR